jgi:hypothetical protein
LRAQNNINFYQETNIPELPVNTGSGGKIAFCKKINHNPCT